MMVTEINWFSCCDVRIARATCAVRTGLAPYPTLRFTPWRKDVVGFDDSSGRLDNTVSQLSRERVLADLGHDLPVVLQELAAEKHYRSSGPYPTIAHRGYIADYQKRRGTRDAVMPSFPAASRCDDESE